MNKTLAKYIFDTDCDFLCVNNFPDRRWPKCPACGNEYTNRNEAPDFNNHEDFGLIADKISERQDNGT